MGEKEGARPKIKKSMNKLTIFEIQTTSLGAQSAVAGGGRYDGLVKSLGGPSQPAIGFAIGFDRLAEIMSQSNRDYTCPMDLFIIALGDQCQKMSFEWLCKLNLDGIRTDMDYGNRSLKSLMKRADKLKAAFVIIVGEEDIQKKQVILRNMTTKEQVPIPVEGIVDTLKSRILK